MSRRGSPRGFALVTVLWVLALAGGISLTAALDGRLSIDAARHRIAHDRGVWQARGCLAVARSELDVALGAVPDGLARQIAWRSAGAVLTDAEVGSGASCEVVAEPVGTRLDVNRATRGQLIALISAADRSSDAVPRAEAILAARTRPFGAVEELRAILRIGDAPGILRHLDVEPAPIALLHAPAPVLASLPGFTPEVIAYVIARRTSARPVADLHELIAGAPSAARGALLSAFAAISEQAAIEPAEWRVVARVSEPGLAPAVVEHLVRRNAHGAFVTRERTW